MVYVITNKTAASLTVQANGSTKVTDPEQQVEFWLDTMNKNNAITVHSDTGSIILDVQMSTTSENEDGSLVEVDSPTRVTSFGNLTVANQMSIDIDDVQTQCVLGRQIEIVMR